MNRLEIAVASAVKFVLGTRSTFFVLKALHSDEVSLVGLDYAFFPSQKFKESVYIFAF